MSSEAIAAIALFAAVASITPGPNNMMLLSSGVRFGLAPTLPHLMGVTIGGTFMRFAVGLGLGGVFATYPPLHHVLFVLSSLYLIYLAWRIASSASADPDHSSSARPLSFLEAAAFQWVNPKSWAVAVSATTGYVPPDNFLRGLLIMVGIVAVVNFPCISVWAGAGAALKQYLADSRLYRLINYSLAGLLVLSVLISVYASYLTGK